MNNEFLNKVATTSIKGIAILLVIIAHIGHDGFGVRLFVPLGCFGVAIFLILSGYGLMESYKRKGLKDFWKKRLLKILIPYLIWICFYSFYLIISNKTFSFDNIRYWFVEYILIWYIAFYMILKFFSSCKWPFFCCIALLLFILMPCLQAQQSLSFIIGVIISNHKERIMNIKTKTILLYGGSFLFIGLMAFLIRQWIFIINSEITVTGIKDLLITQKFDNNDYISKFIQLISKAPIAVFIIIFLNQIHIEKYKWCYITGLAAYELYLVHMPLYPNISNSIYNLMVFLVEISVFSYLLYKCDNVITNLISSNHQQSS